MEPSIPDLLQRFVETPHHTKVSLKNTHVYIESNDPEILKTLTAYLSQNSEDLDLHRLLRIRLVRESQEDTDDAPTLRRIDTSHVTAVLRGGRTILLFDRSTLEILGFIAFDIADREITDHLLTALLKPDQTPSVLELQTGDISTIGL